MLIPSSRELPHLNTILHEGKLVLFGTDREGRIFYTVRQDGYEDSYLNTPASARTGWEDWTELPFPNEAADASVVKQQAEELTYTEPGASTQKYFLKSLYQTRDLTVSAPVQLVSALGHLYVFRQSKSNTLLMDRFVLDGLTNTLTRKLEVRYKRSRQRLEPSKGQGRGDKWLLNTDALDFRDINGNDFYEPTTELCLVDNLQKGEFAVVMLPTDEQDRYRWHIFLYNSSAKKVQLVTLRASDDGLFEVRDYPVFEPVFKVIPGILRQELNHAGASFSRGLTATRYDLQKEQQTDDGPQLMRDAVRVLLAFVTTDNATATLSFGVAPDGTLSQPTEKPTTEVLRRSSSREVLLPASSLDDIRAVASATVGGSVEALKVGENGELLISLSGSGVDTLDGKTIQITNSSHYNQTCAVTVVDGDTFEIVPASSTEVIGAWQTLPGGQDLSFDGQITSYQKTSTGRLSLTAPGHGLKSGDSVQIVDTREINGTYTVSRRADGTLGLNDVSWPGGTALNLTRLRNAQRRGMVFDGVDDHVVLPPISFSGSQGVCLEAWVRFNSFKHWSRIIEFGNGASNGNLWLANDGTTSTLSFGGFKNGTMFQVSAANVLKLNEWMHVAATLDANGMGTVYVNGQKVATSSVPVLEGGPRSKNFLAKSNFDTDGYFHGQLSEVRVWNRVRSAEEIQNALYLDLTGQEDGLSGYWKLSGLMTLPRPTTPDFSSQRGDGTVNGGAYIAGRILNRTLADGSTRAARYLNEDLFAVTGRGTYIEELEFKLPAGKLPTNIDGKGKAVFALTWKGKRGASSRAWSDIPATDAGTTFQALGGDWHRARATFLIPDNISMARMFGLENVNGDWTELEIRNRRIFSVTDTVTERRFGSSSTALALKEDLLANARDSLSGFAAKELRSSQLQLEKQDLERRLAELQGNNAAAITSKQAAVDAQQTRVNDATTQRNLWRDESDTWSKAKATLYTAINYTGDAFELGVGEHGTKFRNDESEVSSIKVPTGLRVYCSRNSTDAWGDYGAPLLENTPYVGDYWNDKIIKVRIYVAPRQIGGVQYDEQKTLDLFQTNYQQKQQALETEAALLAALKAELAALTESEANRTARVQALTTRLTAVKESLATLQTELTSTATTLSASALAPAVKIDTTASVNGLTTQGAVLRFIRPSGRLQAIETCEGNVQLSYFDSLGRMRQTRFDATRDSADATFEQWLPDPLRWCLNQSPNNCMYLSYPVTLGEEWSGEAWFFHPLPEGPSELILFQDVETADVVDAHVLVKRDGGREKLGIKLQAKSEFLDSGFDMKSLQPGWHHLAVVASGTGEKAETRFYIDGRSPDVGDGKRCAVAKKTTRPIGRIGNCYSAQKHFGRLAEVRIWDIALSAEEVLASSQTTLTGNEPGLLAYWSLMQTPPTGGAQIADSSGNGHALTSISSIPWPCTAPIGNPGQRVMRFDGDGDYVQLPSVNFDFKQGMTLEAWVNYDSLKKWSRILELGAGASKGILWLANDDVSPHLSLGVVSATGTMSQMKAENVLRLNEWLHVAATLDGQGNAILYVNGVKVGSQKLSVVPEKIVRGNNYLGKSSWEHDEYFHGRLAEVRVWTKVRTAEEITDDLYRRVAPNAPGLAACWRGQDVRPDGSMVDSVGSCHGVPRGNVSRIFSNTLPICQDSAVSAEYSTVGIDARTGQNTAMMRRFFAASTSSGVHLFTGKRVEALELKWIGNGQFAPTLLGFIEGPPPIPSENLTVEENYNGATSVELTVSEDVAFSWRRAQDVGLAASVDGFLGIDQDIKLLTAPGGIGTQEDLAHIRAGYRGNLTLDYSVQNESSVAASTSNKLIDRLELRGTRELSARFPHLGKRFIPKNVGYALVISALADVFISRLARTKRMIGYQVLPVEGVPPDVNTITFLMNPTYTMNGSLDGLTGSSATSQRYFKQVPAMRSQYGSLYPASYYRLQEAYELKSAIEREDKRREAYFNQFNTLLVDEASLEREASAGPAPGTVSLQRPEDAASTSSGSSTANSQTQAMSGQIDGYKGQASDAYGANSPAVEQKNADIQTKIDDMNSRAHAAACFATWQKRMEGILIRAGKHNIVNTYVWDADGGLRSEEQSFASTAEHTIGGSFALNAALGGEFQVNAAGAQLELSSQLGVSLTQTMSKTESRSRGIELKVDLSGVESRGVTNYDDLPLQPGEKVDRYRFMSFYLEGSTENYHDFFRYVIDPEWLSGNSEEARALRQARGKANKAWRVLHRVTYVERPALSGFGRDLRGVVGAAGQEDLASSIVGLHDRLDAIERQLDILLKR